ncbi:MAG: GDSL-type esterase/lipase family protein [Acidobacteria bacterium]|nr:GDSL-type esterase/lipase family protein [Acidobacteriota bacterium]
MSGPRFVHRFPRIRRSRSRSDRVLGFVPALLLVLLGGATSQAQAAKLVEVSALDRDYLVVHLSDGDVTHDEGGTGETIVRYTPELDTAAASQTGSWTIKSAADASYGTAGQHPQGCHRKKKLSGHAQMGWSGSDFHYEYTYEHWLYLRLPSSLKQGLTYTLEIASATNIESTSASFTFDVFHSRSEAVHVNLVGYAADAAHKAADLYHWMGDGGARDYSTFEGNTVYLLDVDSGEAYPAGLVSFWTPGGSDVGWYDLTGSDVWNVDFPDFANAGIYRLVVEGVGCSGDFEIRNDVYAVPYEVAVRGYFYMRIGEDNPTGISPAPRTPRYVPGVSPASTTVYLTTMQPWHPEWKTFSGGDVWDRPDDWAAYRKAGNPTNPSAWGGHSDAADWDRHLGHVANIYDLLLPFLMTNGAISDDDTGIAESGNGIPDILDEARYEVDFWLRLRDGEGYSHGLTNPNDSNEMFQAGPTAIAAWANAANAAMLADAFRVAGLTTLMDEYEGAAATAYDYADGLGNPMLDEGLELDDGTLRGRDLKMTAAAFLYNLTGAPAYEEVLEAESVCSGAPATLKSSSRNQIYGSAAYLVTPQSVHYPTLQANMKTAILNEARSEEADQAVSRPSRRATDQTSSYFHTAQNVQRTIVAHAVADDPSDRDFFRKALTLEADWGLGRNPLNMIQMTTAFTPLESKRSVPEAYTSGMDDGVAGVHPGHTPYMNLDDWAPGMTMGRPSALYENSYPTNVPSTWPIGEAYFPSRWVWAHNEFTPRQTMRGKMALYGYLHGLAATTLPANPSLTVGRTGNGSGTVTSSPPGIDCGSDCSEEHAPGTSVTLTATADSESVFGGWGGACSGTDSCDVVVDTATSVTAAFNTSAYTLGVDDVSVMETDAGGTALAFTVTLTASTLPDTYTLSVSTSGSGRGTVTASPAGISCGSDCHEVYDAATTVTLTPSVASGSTFAGWSGDCAGFGECTVTMSAARSVTATFDGPATVPGGLRWVGRVDATDPGAVRFAWQGAGFVAAMAGPTVSVNLRTSGATTVFFQPVVDGLPGDRFEVTQGGVQTVTLASGLSSGDHVIELYRETEGMYGVSTFLGFAEGTVTGAPATSGRIVEVVGDSISAGYGNLGVEPHPGWVANPACHWTADNSSWFQTYAAVAGRAFGADVSTVARSGWGMSRDRDGSTSGVLSSVYGNAVGTEDTTPWSFAPEASVVIVNLGTNDISPGDPGTAYETAYISFLQDVRSRYPEAWIFATIGSMLGGSELDTINAHLANVVAALGDDRVVTFDLGTQEMGSNGEIPTGCDWHPNVVDNARMAEIIKARLQTHLGW